jgi:hypothetical protein
MIRRLKKRWKTSDDELIEMEPYIFMISATLFFIAFWFGMIMIVASQPKRSIAPVTPEASGADACLMTSQSDLSPSSASLCQP